MGMKKIRELRNELRKKEQAFDEFRKASEDFSTAYGKIAAAYEGVLKLRMEQRARVEKLETLGIKEFEDYRKALVSLYSGWGDRPLPLTPLEAAVRKQRDLLRAEERKLVDKMAASMPAEVKEGMVFKSTLTGVLREIASEQKTSANPNLKDDARLYYETKDEEGKKSSSLSLKELKASYRFIKT